MSKSTDPLAETLAALRRRAAARGLTDSQWARRARVRKETLSRLRHRRSCDFATLQSLARVVGARLGVIEPPAPDLTADGHFPAAVNRTYEERLLELCASGDVDPARWRRLGTSFFMAGLAVMLASTRHGDRRALLGLAERLHPGASDTAVFNRWLEGSPVRPTRFLSLLDAEIGHAA
jgi:hypothetical protein